MFRLRFVPNDWKIVGVGLVIGLTLAFFMHGQHAHSSAPANTMDSGMHMDTH